MSDLGHSYRKRAALGYDEWSQCVICGATQHHGFYWFAGYRNVVEPPCVMAHGKSAVVRAWKSTAEQAEDSVKNAGMINTRRSEIA